jgi:hypothetical protein
LEILRDGKRVFTAYGEMFIVGTDDKNGRLRDDTAMGKDITGDGIGNLVITELTGGIHSNNTVHIFELGPKLRFIQSIHAPCGGGVGFFKLDTDPGLEYELLDRTFAYWHQCFIGSPAPQVVLKYNGSKYVFAPGLMRQNPPTDEKLRNDAQEIAGSVDWSLFDGDEEDWPDSIPPRLLEEMLDLIYTGNMSAAWRLCNLAWTGKSVSKEKFLHAFKAHLETSPYWPDVRRMNEAGHSTARPSNAG